MNIEIKDSGPHNFSDRLRSWCNCGVSREVWNRDRLPCLINPQIGDRFRLNNSDIEVTYRNQKMWVGETVTWNNGESSTLLWFMLNAKVLPPDGHCATSNPKCAG